MTPALSRTLKIAASLVAAGCVVGALVVLLGLVPIKASAGHWRPTHELLEFVKRRSVATQAWGTKLPTLQDPALVLHGAGTYHGNCLPCHGSPEFQRPLVPAALLPPPPYLAEMVHTYEPEELFGIVKHGIKFTGMPAWPTQNRDDEVVAMVAFLLELPKLDAAAYRELVHGTAAPNGANDVGFTAASGLTQGLPSLPSAALAVTTSCARCHGADGLGRGLGAFPKIAGQKREYLLRAMDAYADNRRASGSMAPVAAALQAEERRVLADYYAALPTDLPPPQVSSDDTRARALRGAAIASDGISHQGVPPCRDCHGPASHARNAAYPNLAGQYASYLLSQLELFKTGKRGGSSYAHLMLHVATRLTREQMIDVAAYYASLDASGTGSDDRQ